MTDIVCFYVKTVFMFQKTKNKQIKKNLQQKYKGFEINQQIVYIMRLSVGHGYSGIQKFNTLMKIPK